MNYDQIISLLDVYFNEWAHRDNSIWNHVFKYFIATLIIMIMPNIANGIGLDMDIPPLLFRFVGLGIAIFAFYAGMAYALRLDASSQTYRNILNKLPEDYRRVTLKDVNKGKKKKKKKYNMLEKSLAYNIPKIIFISMIILFFILVFFVDGYGLRLINYMQS